MLCQPIVQADGTIVGKETDPVIFHSLLISPEVVTKVSGGLHVIKVASP